LALASFLAGVLPAAGNGVAIRFCNRELAPLWGATLRFILAAIFFIGFMAVLRLRLPRGRALVGAMLYGAIYFGGSSGLAYYALIGMHAGQAQTLLALVPLMTLLLAALYRQEHLRLAGVLGTLMALGGIAVMSRATLQGGVSLVSLLAILGSAFCIAQMGVLVRRFPQVHPVTMNAVGMTAGTALLLVGSMLFSEPLVVPQRATTLLALGYLVPSSVIVFGLYLVVLRYWAASRAAYSYVLIPVVTIFLSVWLDNERLDMGLLIGGLLVLSGVYVGALRPGGAVPTEPAFAAMVGEPPAHRRT
jgi:drug/metabolite transporter (DMT)-like permease